MEGNAAGQATGPSVHLPLPVGFSIYAFIECKQTRDASSFCLLRTTLRAHCPKHNKTTKVQSWQHLRSFLKKHATCRPEWQPLRLQAQESDKEHLERLKAAGLRYHNRIIKQGDSPVDMLQDMLCIPRTEAAAIACASGVKDEECVWPTAAQRDEPVMEPQLLQLPVGFTFATHLDRSLDRGRDTLHLIFKGQCPKHNCVKLFSCPALRSFVNKHAACRPEWHALAAQEGELELEHNQRLQRAGLRFCRRLLKPGKSVAEVLQDMLGISAAEATAIIGPTPASAKVGLGDSDDAEEMDVDSDNEEPAQEAAVQALPQLPAGFSLHVWREVKREGRKPILHVHFKGHCNRCNRNPILNGPTMLRAFLQKHGSCRPEWGPLGQRQGESEGEHTERMQAAGFQICNRVIHEHEGVQDVLQAMLAISAADAAAVAHACGLCLESSSMASPTQAPGDVAAGKPGEPSASAAVTPGGGNVAASWLPAGFSVSLRLEQEGKKLRVDLRPQCLKHNVATLLAGPSALRSFLDKHAACRPEWQPLALQPSESEADHTARLREAGLRFRSRMLEPSDSMADVLQELLSIPAAEAAAIANAAGFSADADADAPMADAAASGSPDGSSNAIAEPEPAADGTVDSEVRAALLNQQTGTRVEGNAAVQMTGPSAHPPLPIGFSTSAYIEIRRGEKNACVCIRTFFKAHCPQHDRTTKFQHWQHLRSFLDTHAACRQAILPTHLCSPIFRSQYGKYITYPPNRCKLWGALGRPEWQQLQSRAEESEEQHKERLRRAGLQFRSRVIKKGDRPEDMLQEMLGISPAEAAAIACAYRVGANAVGSPSVGNSKDAAAATAFSEPALNEGGTGTAAAKLHKLVGKPQLPQLPTGFTFATRLEHRPPFGPDSLRLMFRGECPKHNRVAKLGSTPLLRHFVNKHAACRPEWRALAAQEGESELEHDERLLRAGLRCRSQVMKPGKSVAEALQDMLGITAAEAAAIVGPTPADAAPGLGASPAGIAPASLEESGAAAGRCGGTNAAVKERRPAASWVSLELPRGLTIAVHREPSLSGGGDRLCVYFKGFCLKHYADVDLRTLQHLKVFLEEHAVCRQEWQRLCKQPGESCEQHDERLDAAGLEYHTCTIQPREAVWETLQRMLGVSPSDAWKIASTSGHGSIGGGVARSLERPGAGAAAAANAIAQDPQPAARRAPPQLPAGMRRVLYIQKCGTKRPLAMANLWVACAQHKTHRSTRGYTELRNFMAAHAECMPAWRSLQQREGESVEDHRERLKGEGLTFAQKRMPATLWQQPAATFLQECLGVSREEALALVNAASDSRSSAPDQALAAGQPGPSGSGDDDSDEENMDADEGNSDSDVEEVWAQGVHRAGGAGGGGGDGQGRYVGEDEPDEAPGAGQANGWDGAGDDGDNDDEDDEYREVGLPVEEGDEEDNEGEDENDDDVEIVEHGTADWEVLQHLAAAPCPPPAAAPVVVPAANQALVPIQDRAPPHDGVVVPVVDARAQVAGPSSPDMDVLQARAEMAEGEVKMLRNNMKHSKKVNEKLQAIIKKQAEQIKSLEAYNRAATTKNALAIGLSVTGMAAVRVIASAAAAPGSASVAHAPAPAAAAPAAAAAANVPTANAPAPAAAAPAVAAQQPRGRTAAAEAGAGGPKGGPETPAGEPIGRDGRGSRPARKQEDSNGRSPRRHPDSAAVTSAGPKETPPTTRSALQAQSGGRGRGSQGGGSQARSAGQIAPTATAAGAVAERRRSGEAPASSGRFKRERAFLEGDVGADSLRTARKSAAKPAQRFDPTPMTRQQQAAATTQHPTKGAGALATGSGSPATQTRKRGAALPAANAAPERAAAADAPDEAPPAKRPKFPFRLVKEPRQVSAAEAERADRRAGKRPAEGQPATADADVVRRRLLHVAETARAFAVTLTQAPDRQMERDILRYHAGRIKEEKLRINDVRRKSL